MTLCMGRMRKEIMGRFLQSGWLSILVSTSLKTEFLELQQSLERDWSQRLEKKGKLSREVEGKLPRFKGSVQ